MKKTLYLRNQIIFLFILFLFFSCKKQESGNYWPTDEWRTSTPEGQWVSSLYLIEPLKDLIEDPDSNLHSFLLIRNGYIIVEYYAPCYSKDTLNNLHSATKSFTGTLTGIAVRKRLFQVDDKVLSFFPDESFQYTDEYKKEMTIEHLLTMSSGLNWSENRVFIREINNGNEMVEQKDWGHYILDQKMLTEPGVSFNYNSGNSHLLNVILSKKIKGSVQEFAEDNLFNPLGIKNYYWAEDPKGIPVGGAGLCLTSRDMAKLGYLYLNNGEWEGKRLLSKEWVNKAATDYYPDDDRYDYGYQFWIYPYSFYAYGFGYQAVYVVPGQQYIVVITGASGPKIEDALERFWPRLSEAVLSDSPLPPDPQGFEIFQSTIDSLSTEETIHQQIPTVISDYKGKEISFSHNQTIVSNVLLKKPLRNNYIDKITIDNINDDELTLNVAYLYPDRDMPLDVTYQIGFDNCYRLNDCRELYLVSLFNDSVLSSHYPNPEKYKYALKAKFPDKKTIEIDCEVIGSALPAKWSLRFESEKVYLDIILTQGDSYYYQLTGELKNPGSILTTNYDEENKKARADDKLRRKEKELLRQKKG